MPFSISKISIVSLMVLITLLGGNSESVKLFFQNINPDNTAKQNLQFAHGSVDVSLISEGNLLCTNGRPTPDSLIVKSDEAFFLRDYESKLYHFILERSYADLDWCVDFKVRDTGPFIKGNYYGIHPAVRIYYSPRLMYWLTGDKSYWPHSGVVDKAPRQGPVPTGAMIVKEMFTPPADIYAQLDSLMKQSDSPECKTEKAYQELVSSLITSWAVMVKTEDMSNDDWFWANLNAAAPGESVSSAVNRQLDDYQHILYSGFGLSCMRCHASAEGDLTFSDLNNITGQDALIFRNDNSWRNKSHLVGSKENPGPLAKVLDQACFNDSAVQQLLILPKELLPWTDENVAEWKSYMSTHMPPIDPNESKVHAPKRTSVNEAFLSTYPEINQVNKNAVREFPIQWTDHVVPGPDGPDQYLTSDNCIGCHGGLGGDPYDIAMFVKTGPNYGDGYNVSEYGEWRWSPMGLAGRDPIFYAQLESEMALLEKDAKTGGLLHGSLEDNQEQIVNTCESCHGSMGQRQLKIDAAKDPSLDPNFKVDYVYLTEALSAKDTMQENYDYHKYGALAREGISCATCHHIDAPNLDSIQAWKPEDDWVLGKDNKSLAYYLFHNTTGQYSHGPADELYGPFDDAKKYPMEKQMGISPVGNDFISSSEMCGTCHSINLPNIGLAQNKFPVLNAAEQNPVLKPYNHTIEQATFLEWKNSDFARGETFQSCQDCHMPGGFESLDSSIVIDQLTTKIATIQDMTYPATAGLAASEDIGVTLRDDYKRHEHVGLNVFLLEMFDQFPEILGVAKNDYMTGATNGNALAIENMVKQAREETVDIDFTVSEKVQDSLDILVTVSNKTGHRFPSGVSFRRAFLELLVLDGSNIIWGSGRTNSVGVIVDQYGQPLQTEFLPNGETYQAHHQLIRDQKQVQIYEELNHNVDSEFTTSFVHRVEDIKDNRLLPKGAQSSEVFKDQGEVIYQFMQATDPNIESIKGDSCYIASGNEKLKGQDQIIYRVPLPNGGRCDNLSIKVTMYSQAIPPYYLKQRFSIAPEGEATQRLYYLASNLNLDSTIMENWKLPLVSSTQSFESNTRSWSPKKME